MQQRELPAPLEELNPRVPHELADAVAMALEIDQEARPADAMQLAKAVQDGASGLPPLDGESPTVHLGTKAATRVLPRTRGETPTGATRVAPRPRTEQQPTARTSRQAVPPRVILDPAPRHPAGRGPSSGARTPSRGRRTAGRLFAFAFIALVFVVAVVIAVTIATSTSSTAVHVKNVIAGDVQTALNDIHKFIGSFTK
jgi:hypothetical protein